MDSGDGQKGAPLSGGAFFSVVPVNPAVRSDVARLRNFSFGAQIEIVRGLVVVT